MPSREGWQLVHSDGAVLFMVGSACFALASFVGLDKAFQNVTVINAVFFAGSIFFTAASYLQLLEATNTNRRAGLARLDTGHPRIDLLSRLELARCPGI